MSCGGELCDITTLKKTAQVCCGSLYKHIRRFGSVSPTIKEAKNELSRKKYFCVVDLANYYYQGGMKRQDCAYLAVMHPTCGVMVYSASPQGLKNSSEFSYNCLGRVFGKMVEDALSTW